MKIEGKVETIIFKSEASSWTVMLLKVDNKYISAVGETVDVEIGDELELEGVEDTHKVYGEQFKFSTYKKVLPKTNATLIQYISNGVKGIGKKTAKSIVDKFGDETVEIIRFSPSKLEGMKGLNSDKIFNLSNFLNEEWERWNTVDYLGSFGISVLVATKIYHVLKNDTIKIVKEDPYSLINFVKTLEFSQIDEIGKKLNIPKDNKTRIDTGIIYTLTKITDFGHTCVEIDTLTSAASKTLEVLIEDIENSIIRLKMEEKLFSSMIGDEEYVFRRSYYLAEDNIATNIVEHTMQKKSNKDYISTIDEVSKKNNIELSSEQIQAISTCLNNSISIITGGPGTGKTTVIKCIIDILESIKKEYVLAAPTGRAAKRITQTTGKEAKTLHRLLEITKVDDRDLDMFYETAVRSVEADYVIVDEASMIDCLMMNNLFKAINAKTKIIMVGDVDQLPSVGPGKILKDIIDSNVVNVVYLKQIYRQSAKSDIIVNAHKVNNGENLDFKTKDTDLFFIKTSSAEDTISEISSLLSHRLEAFAKFDILKDLQVLTPMKKTHLGTIELNGTIQGILNKKTNFKAEKEYMGKVFRVGDKVMQVINNYDRKFTIDGNAFDGVYNGDIGFIQDVNNNEKHLTVLFDDEREVIYDFEDLDELEHAYAVTIHKSQGCEFDYVLIPLYTGYPKLFTRNLLYTAMTRAKKMLIIVGSTKAISYMVSNVNSNERKTGLKFKIQSKL